MTQSPDPALLEALAKRNEKPHLKQDEDKTEGQKVFHPGAAKAMKLRQATLCDSIEPPKVDPAKIDEAVTLTTEARTCTRDELIRLESISSRDDARHQ